MATDTGILDTGIHDIGSVTLVEARLSDGWSGAVNVAKVRSEWRYTCMYRGQ